VDYGYGVVRPALYINLNSKSFNQPRPAGEWVAAEGGPRFFQKWGRPPMETARKSELAVVTKAKNLCAYIITITQKSPK
jgi:hypothetical protein